MMKMLTTGTLKHQLIGVILFSYASIIHYAIAEEKTNATSSINSRLTSPTANFTNGSFPETILSTMQSIIANELDNSTGSYYYSTAKTNHTIAELITVISTDTTAVSHSITKDHLTTLDERDQKLDELMNTAVLNASDLSESREGSGDETSEVEHTTTATGPTTFNNTSGSDITPAFTKISNGSSSNHSLFYETTTTALTTISSENFNHSSVPIISQTTPTTTISTSNSGTFNITSIPKITPIPAITENVSIIGNLVTAADTKFTKVPENESTFVTSTISVLTTAGNVSMVAEKTPENVTNIGLGDEQNAAIIATTAAAATSSQVNGISLEEQITTNHLSITELSTLAPSKTHGTLATISVSKGSSESPVSSTYKNWTSDYDNEVDSIIENHTAVYNITDTISDQRTIATKTFSGAEQNQTASEHNTYTLMDMNAQSTKPSSTMFKCYDNLTEPEFLNTVTVTLELSPNIEFDTYSFMTTIVCMLNLYESLQWPPVIQNLTGCSLNDSEHYTDEKQSTSHSLIPSDLVIIQPTPKVINNDEIVLAFFTRNSSTKGTIVSRNKTIKIFYNHREFIENQIGVNITDIYGGLWVSQPLSPTMEPFYTRHYLLLVTIILVASICILIIIIGLLYIKCRTAKRRWNSNNSFNHEKAELQKDMCTEMGENLTSDDDIRKDETLRAINNGNGFFGTDTGSGSSVIPIGDEDGWVIPYDELSSEEKSTVEIEDTKL